MIIEQTLYTLTCIGREKEKERNIFGSMKGFLKMQAKEFLC